MREMDTLMSQYSVFLSSTDRRSLGPDEPDRSPGSRPPRRLPRRNAAPIQLMITGRLYDEGTLLRVALAHEQATTWHMKTPSLT